MDRSTIFDRDNVNHWLYRGKADDLRGFADVNRHNQAAIRHLQRVAETAYPQREINGVAHRVRLYAWPFIVSVGDAAVELPANLGVYFQSLDQDLSKRLTACWAQMLPPASKALCYALPAPVHAHAVYGLSPFVVHKVIREVALSYDTNRPMPRGLDRVSTAQAFRSLGAQCAPLLLLAAVFVPDTGVADVVATRNPAAMRTAQDIVSAALSTMGSRRVDGTNVQALVPQPFFEALESTLRADLFHGLRWSSVEHGGFSQLQCMYDGDGGDDVFTRELSFGYEENPPNKMVQLAFDSTWLWSGALDAICKQAQECGATVRHRQEGLGPPPRVDPNGLH